MTSVAFACKLHNAMEDHTVRRRASTVLIVVLILVWIGMGVRIWYAKQAHERMRTANETLLAALDSTETAVMIADRDGVITTATKQAEDLFGTSLVGKHGHDFCPEEYRAQADAALSAAVETVEQTGRPRTTQVKCVLPRVNKPPLPVQLTMRTVRQDSGDVIIIVSIIQLTHLQEAVALPPPQ